MSTDSPFYQLFLLLRESIFYLIDLDPALAQFYDFASVEVKELKRTIDGVYLPQRTQDPIIFVEVQFQPDPTLYQRLITEGFVYLGQQNPENEDWLMVAIWPRQSLDPGIPGFYKTIHHQIIRVYLDELPLDVEPLGLVLMRMMAGRLSPQVQMLGQRALEKARATENPETLKLVKTLLAYRYPKLSLEEVAKMFTFSKEEMKSLRIYQEGVEEGEERGIQLGKQEGIQLGKLQAVSTLYALGLSVDQISQRLDLDPSLIQQAIENSGSPQ